MSILQRLSDWFAAPGVLAARADRALDAALASFLDPQADPLLLLRRLVASLRPRDPRDAGEGERRRQRLIDALEADPALLTAFRGHMIRFLASRRLITFFTDSGILPGTGFFSEWWRIVCHTVLPEVPDERSLKDCVHLMYDRTSDWRWMLGATPEQSRRLAALLAPPGGDKGAEWHAILNQFIEAVLLLSHRVSGLGIEPELLRATPDFDSYSPHFLAVAAEAQEFTARVRARLAAGSEAAHPAGTDPVDDGHELRGKVAACLAALQRLRMKARSSGTSLHLTYLLTRNEQILKRLGELVRICAGIASGQQPDAANTAWADFAREAFIAENRRNSLPHYWNNLTRLLALRITENAAHTGEHYISETPAEYATMWRSAAGAGVVIAFMAFIKIEASLLHAPLLVEAFLYSMIYGCGFVLIYLCGMTVATKQPAMTAQTLASYLASPGAGAHGRDEALERVVDLTAAVSRSQVAAILGNVLVALPVAIGIGLAIGAWRGEPAIPLEKAAHLLADLDILGWAVPHAAVAGFYLFLSGLITGFFDNQASFGKVGPRIARLRPLRGLLGKARAQRVGAYLQDHMGGIMGNFLFGCMLGSTGMLGVLLGLPLDIRHIAFSSANVGYALTGFGLDILWQTLAWSVLGVAVIGLTNLTVSFALALRTALGARGTESIPTGRLLALGWLRLRREPMSFLVPPRIVAARSE
jgi:site-specific recombinase